MSDVSQSQPAPPRLLKSSALVGSMTLLSRVMGLLRDIVFARFIGSEAGADAFFVAFKIPNFLRRLFAEGAFSQAFVPVLSEYRERGSPAAVKALVDRVTGCLGATLMAVTVFAVLCSPVLATLFAPGFRADAEKFSLASDMIRITFPYLLFISLTGLAGAILNSYDRFAVPAFTPVLLNVSMITAAVVISPYFEQPVFALAWGVLSAGVVQLLFQLPFLIRLQLLPRPQPDWRDAGVRKILKLMAPAIFGVSVSQINLLLDTVIASFLPTGSVSWLYYSDRLSELPLGVFGIAVATVILPGLSRQHAGGNLAQFSATLDWALRLIVVIALPAALALIILAEPILFTLFQYGKTDAYTVHMAAMSLRAYAAGLLAFMLIKVLAPGYFARQDTKTPVKIGIVAMIANMILNVVFVLPLYFYFNLGHMGLALATACSAYINAALLLHGLWRNGIYRPQPGWITLAWRFGFANLSMAAALVFLLLQWNGWEQWNWMWRSIYLSIMCMSGLAVYVLALVAAGGRIKDFRVRH